MVGNHQQKKMGTKFFSEEKNQNKLLLGSKCFRLKQDSSRKCSAWKDFRLNPLSFQFPKGIGLSVVGGGVGGLRGGVDNS